MGHDEGLTATYKTQRPPWLGIWSSKEYTGRPEWWKEAGQKDEVVRNGQFRMNRARYLEEDPDWYDRKVPDGTSIVGPLGLDSTKHKDITKKADTPGDLDAFQHKIMTSSSQYKSIAEAFNLSPEHPGIKISPSGSDLGLMNKYEIGRNAPLPPRLNYAIFCRFFDQPLNEGTGWKALAAMKYTLLAMVPVTAVEIRARKSIEINAFTYRTYLKRLAQLSPVPLALSVTWAVALSTAANIRNKDDVTNHFYSSAAVGVTLATIKDSVPKGLTLATVSLVLGVFWHYARVSETGLQSRAVSPSTGGLWSGPFAWKMAQFGDRAVPDATY